MTAFKRFGFLFVCAALLIPQMGLAQVEMTYEEYEVKLLESQNQAAKANTLLADCKAAGEKLSQQIADTDAQIAAVQQEIYKLVGADEQGIKDYLRKLDSIEQQLMGLLSLSDEDLADKRDEFDNIVEMVKTLKGNKIALLPQAQAKLRNIDQLIERINARMPRKRIKKYMVVRGDNLWNIAKMPVHYSDPYMWPRIYVENRARIKDPNLIYPDWNLNVPIGVDQNQHLVLRGQHLTSIAQTVYKDMTKWPRLYQANKAQILDPNLIFPAQVIEIPAN